MSWDSIVYLSVAGLILVGGLVMAGYVTRDDDGLDMNEILGGAFYLVIFAIAWPAVLAAGALSLPFWAGRALAAHHDRRQRRKDAEHADMIASLHSLRGMYPHGSETWTVLDDLIKGDKEKQ